MSTEQQYDPHVMRAAELFGIEPGAVSREQRHLGKTANFMEQYQATPEAVACAMKESSKAASIVAREINLREANEAYADATPIMSDANYDDEWRTHERDRQDYPSFFDPKGNLYLFGSSTSILDQVGSAPRESSGFAKVRHGTPMLSINDVFEGDGAAKYEELIAFVRKMESKLGNDAWPMDVSTKVDGLALKIIFSNSLLRLAVTRGNGGIGDDVTDNVRIKNLVPQSIAPDEPWGGTRAHPLQADHLEIAGEVFMPLVEWAAANEERAAEGLDLWKNPRNAAAGSLKLHDKEELLTRPLSFVQYSGPYIEGIQRVPTVTVHSWVALVDAIETIRKGGYAFATDGAVVKVANEGAREVVGMGTRAPNWACAFKFKPVKVTTKLTGIAVQVGRTGALTPKAELEPVDVAGTTVSSATLNNEAWIQDMHLKIGDTVELHKAGEIIPEIVRSVTHDARIKSTATMVLHENSDIPLDLDPDTVTPEEAERHDRLFEEVLGRIYKPFDLIEHLGGKCPCCGSADLGKKEVGGEDGVKIYCMNAAACPAQLSRLIQHFCSRGCLDIEGIGKEASIAIADHMGKLWEEDQVSPSPLNLFDWIPTAFAMLRWTTPAGGSMTFGPARANKACKALIRAQSLPLHRWIRALGIHTVGEGTSKEISRLFMSAEHLQSLTFSDTDEEVAQAVRNRYDPAPAEFQEDFARYAISPRLGPESARRLVEFVSAPEGQEVLRRMVTYGIRSDNYDPRPVASATKPLFGKTFAITGTLSCGRDEMKALIESSGGKVSGSISKKLTGLICGEGGGGKRDKAAAQGITTLTEAEIREML